MVKLIQHIFIVFIGIIYFVSSSGVLVYKTNCSCRGTVELSVFIQPETCESNIHQHHNHDTDGQEILVSCNQCHECSNHEDDCGCSSPEVKFFKLVDQLINDDASYIPVTTLSLLEAFIHFQFHFLEEPDKVEPEFNYFPPPLIQLTSLEFLVQINQLKIPNFS